MPFLPINILSMWLSGLFSLGIIGGGAYLLHLWYRHAWIVERVTEPGGAIVSRVVFDPSLGWDAKTAYLAAGLGLLTLAFAGRLIGQGLGHLFRRSDADEPKQERGGEVHRLKRPNGTELQVEMYGPADAPAVILTHGWGANGTEWYYTKKALAGRFRVITWDLPGLGLSRKPDDNDYRLETMAADLDAILDLIGGPALLVGHSIGGMITLTYCKAFPGSMKSRVAGLVLVHTTHTNPVRTTNHASLYTALEKPVLVPLLRLTIALWPLVWLMNWLGYLNGSTHRSTARESFAGTESSGQVDFTARFAPHGRPDVLARGMFGMIGYDATDVLPAIDRPTLVVAGDKDITTLPEASERIDRDVPASRLFTLRPARHMGLIEHHKAFNEALAEFAATCFHDEAGRETASTAAGVMHHPA